ncbi:hypothetical protein ER70_07855 (plasmid) [Borreliella bissettiae]|uniref:Uncharacterized protein n=1 Tax=Borrelia bissettiae TaxID=64897 RepID=A0A1L8ZA25_BORBI|nr:hypothetical protein ER70_07855 [Borreliella bissettiae]
MIVIEHKLLRFFKDLVQNKRYSKELEQSRKEFLENLKKDNRGLLSCKISLIKDLAMIMMIVK